MISFTVHTVRWCGDHIHMEIGAICAVKFSILGAFECQGELNIIFCEAMEGTVDKHSLWAVWLTLTVYFHSFVA